MLQEYVYHQQQVYQQGSYSHFSNGFPLQFSFCFVILNILALLKTDNY